ncbi:MAG: MotA/TolQ/ExbB proton channel family protein [Helicobacteraceae bacterium]|nr:MotA/TolQ/ExbB proton channel family protein [Helicobacteraceae bacterium]
MIDALIDFYLKSHVVTLSVLFILSIYFFVINWVFLYRYFSLSEWISKENQSLESLLMGSNKISEFSYLSNFINASKKLTREILDLGKYSATKEATKGLSTLSVVASTAPFIGLFGTVVSLLDTFGSLGGHGGTMALITAGVSDALVATAAGIFVAIFAYTYHEMLKRSAYELSGLISMQSDAVLATQHNITAE